MRIPRMNNERFWGPFTSPEEDGSEERQEYTGSWEILTCVPSLILSISPIQCEFPHSICSLGPPEDRDGLNECNSGVLDVSRSSRVLAPEVVSPRERFQISVE